MTRDIGEAQEFGCLICNRHEYVNAKNIGLPDSYPVPKFAAPLIYDHCGFRNPPTSSEVWARPDVTPPGYICGIVRIKFSKFHPDIMWYILWYEKIIPWNKYSIFNTL